MQQTYFNFDEPLLLGQKKSFPDLSPIKSEDKVIGDFICAPHNEEAYKALDEHSLWLNNSLIIAGDKACGKTHLGHLWAQKHDALCLSGYQESAFLLLRILGEEKVNDEGSYLACGRDYIWLDDAHKANDIVLMAVLNLAKTRPQTRILLSARPHKQVWPLWQVHTQDVRSRLQNTPFIAINPPAETFLGLILERFFFAYGRLVSDTVIQYILTHAPRELGVLQTIAAHLHKCACAQNTDINRTFVTRQFEGILQADASLKHRHG